MPTGWFFEIAKIVVNGVPIGVPDTSLKNPSGVTTMNTSCNNVGVEPIPDGKVTGIDGRGVGELKTCVDLEEYGSMGTGVELKIPLLFNENSGLTDENTEMAP